MTKLSIDIGNRRSIAYDGTSYYEVMSTLREINKNEVHLGDTVTPTVSFKGQHFHVGASYASNAFTLSELGKNNEEYLRATLYALLPEVQEGDELELVVSSPDPKRYVPLYKKVFKGKHSYKYNGEKRQFTIKSCRIIHEGLGSYIENVKDNAPTLLVDIGCSTFCVSFVVNAKVQRAKAYESMGVRQLVRFICDELTYQLDYEPQPVDIYEAIENGSFVCGGIDFRSIYEEKAKQWLKEVSARVRDEFSREKRKAKRTLYTGGGSFTVKELVGNGYGCYAKDFLYDNVRGGIKLA